MIINKEHTSFDDFIIPKPNFWLIFEKSLICSKRQFFIHFDKQYLFSILSSKENIFIRHFCGYVKRYILNHWFTTQSLNNIILYIFSCIIKAFYSSITRSAITIRFIKNFLFVQELVYILLYHMLPIWIVAAMAWN